MCEDVGVEVCMCEQDNVCDFDWYAGSADG